ncbi:MAG: helix-turn-helix transcriptional regulator [Candidatus Staskawiczbacteria bacterium]|nr:helix-turn-helix transcriptional regulator [Candidatus Staskawiczbacteria bacterium]
MISNLEATKSIQKIRMREISIMMREERIKQGLTQGDLSRIIGLNEGTINRAENGNWISLPCLISILEALDKKISLINK